MHDHPILNDLKSRRRALLAELKRLVEHESPSHDKPALDALAEVLAARLVRWKARSRSSPIRAGEATSSAGFGVPKQSPPP